jgi:hypothetical protein
MVVSSSGDAGAALAPEIKIDTAERTRFMPVADVERAPGPCALPRRKMRLASSHLPTFAGQEQMPRLAKQCVDYIIAAGKSLTPP